MNHLQGFKLNLIFLDMYTVHCTDCNFLRLCSFLREIATLCLSMAIAQNSISSPLVTQVSKFMKLIKFD